MWKPKSSEGIPKKKKLVKSRQTCSRPAAEAARAPRGVSWVEQVSSRRGARRSAPPGRNNAGGGGGGGGGGG